MKKIMKFGTLLVFVLLTIINCKKAELKSSQKAILTFSLPQQISAANIDQTFHLITLVVAEGTDLTTLKPQITVSDKATITPGSGVATDFSKGPVTYKVTAEDGSTQDWTVSVTAQKSSQAYILSFTVDSQIGTSVITDSTVSVVVDWSVDLSKISPHIKVSPGASVAPSTGVEKDFSSGPVIYTVTAEDGKTTRTYSVSITRKLSDENKLISISVPDQIGNPIISGQTIILEVPDSTDLTSIAPTIVVSDYAKVNPGSGVPQNFSNSYVLYKIASESGKISSWLVYVRHFYYKPYDPKFEYTGRVDFSDSLAPKFWEPGVSITTKFQGTYFQALMNDQGIGNFIMVTVDNQDPTKIQLQGGSNEIMVAQNLTDGPHTIVICKNTESNEGFIQFTGARCQELLTPDPLPTRKIEFYGNSITSGTDADVTDYSCDASYWHQRHSAYYSYGLRTARNLNAQGVLSSYSGIGIIHSCCGITHVMADVYDKMDMADDAVTWDFSRWVPNVVTICLGQNDGIQDSTAFCGAYVDLIKKLRGHYPDAQIVCLNSPIADATLNAVLKNYLTGIVDYMNNSGDNKVSKYFFTKSWNNGCNSHPSIADHKEIAAELTTYLQTLMGW